jgi:hypothetical protein
LRLYIYRTKLKKEQFPTDLVEFIMKVTKKALSGRGKCNEFFVWKKEAKGAKF